MLNPTTILLIAYHFDPSNEIGGRRPTELARFLINKGFRVVVVSAFGGASQSAKEELPGLVRVTVSPPRKWLIDAVVRHKRKAKKSTEIVARNAAHTVRAKHGAARALVNLRHAFFRVIYLVDEHKRWAWLASIAALRAGRLYKAALVISSSPPNSVLLGGEHAARRLRIPHIADLRDPWVDALPSNDPISMRLQRHLERRVIQHATAITTTSAAVAGLMIDRHPSLRERFHVVRNGYDAELIAPETKTGHRLSILFAGELYVGRNPFPFLSALEVLLARADTDSTRISVTFMGRASSYDGQSLTDWMRGKRCAEIVKVTGQLPQVDVAREISNSTLLLNLSQGQRLSIPAKTFEHLVSGREILLLCENDCETAQLVADINGVVQVDPTDTEKLQSALTDVYQRHVVEGILNAPTAKDVVRFSRESANEGMLRVICDVLHTPVPTSTHAATPPK